MKVSLLKMMALMILLSGIPAGAVVFPDEQAQDMLTNTDAGHENESEDAVSKWGTDHKDMHKKVESSQNKLMPIAEGSFQTEATPTSRSPASEPSRSPSGGKVAVISAEEEALPKEALKRAIANKKAYQEVAIIANDLGFYPSTVFVTQGIPVRVFLTGASPHSQCFMSDAYGIRRQIKSQQIEEINFTPDQSGTFTFSCPMNGAKGMFVVKELDLGRVPAGVQVSRSEEGDEVPKEAAKHKPSLIKDSDFGAEFQH